LTAQQQWNQQYYQQPYDQYDQYDSGSEVGENHRDDTEEDYATGDPTTNQNNASP